VPLVESLFSPYFATLNRTARQDLPKAAALSHLDRVERQDHEHKRFAADLRSGNRRAGGSRLRRPKRKAESNRQCTFVRRGKARDAVYTVQSPAECCFVWIPCARVISNGVSD